ncbi:MAG: peptidoglycan-associated lipoprotein Pal [Candidatus Methylomirabilia bacterium]
MVIRVMPLLVSVALAGLAAVGCAKQPVQKAAAPAPSASTPGTAAVPKPEEAVKAEVSTPIVRAAVPKVMARKPLPKEFSPTPELTDIHFEFDKYDIHPRDEKHLNEAVRWMKVNGDGFLLIEGHADERGTNEYNLALGEQRANAAMKYLVSRGVEAHRITTISYGEERPVCTEKTEACWEKNRRAHFLVKLR